MTDDRKCTRGKVKFYRVELGYGFIVGDDGLDYWFNRGCLPRNRRFDPVEGDIVEFETREMERGLAAHHINLDPDNTYENKDANHAMRDVQVQRGPEG